MKFNNKIVATFACASALAMTGVAIMPGIVQNQAFAVNSGVNNTVNAYKFGKPQIQYRNSTFTEDFEFDKGRPEGIVVHETATPGATAENEATYFLREWSNMYAYVHAFVDHTGVIQIHPTNRGVWGAGPKGNSRFIQVELCQESNAYNFALSVSNDAYYIATLLKQYGLKPDLAEHDGVGTVWSHSAVSKFLGGTDHTDPTGYFAKWGYSMDQFYDLIVQKYNEISGNGGGSVQPPAGPDYSLMGKTTAAGAPNAQVLYKGNIAVFSAPGQKPTGQYVKSLSNWAVTGKANALGRTWYRVGTNQWLDGQYVYVKGTNSIPTVNNAVQPPKPSPNYALMGKTAPGGNANGQVLYKGNIAVFGAPGQKPTGQYVKSLSNWKVTGKASALGRTWYRVGTNQWLDGQYLYVTGTNSIPTVNNAVQPPKPGPNYALMGKTAAAGNPNAQVLYKGNIAVFAAPGQKATGQSVKTLSNWKVTGKASALGRTWYRVGTNQWLDGQYLYVTGTAKISNVATNTPNEGIKPGTVGRVNYKPGYGIAVWSQPGKSVTGKYLPHGSGWKVYAKQAVGGKTWYNLGGNQWVDGQYLTF